MTTNTICMNQFAIWKKEQNNSVARLLEVLVKSYLLELGIHLVSSFIVVFCGDLVELSTLWRKKSVGEIDALKM